MKCPVPECGGELLNTLEDHFGLVVCHLNLTHAFPKTILDRITIAPLPKVEPWKPRTKQQLSDAWDLGYQNLGPPLQWSVQARTDDIARMLEEEAEKIGGESEAPPWGYGAKLLRRMARRIRALE